MYGLMSKEGSNWANMGIHVYIEMVSGRFCSNEVDRRYLDLMEVITRNRASRVQLDNPN